MTEQKAPRGGKKRKDPPPPPPEEKPAAPPPPEVRQTEVVRLDDLVPHPRNYKTHPPDQIAHIQASLRQHGWYRNIVIARDGTVLAGHGVRQAAMEMGLEEGPAIRLPIDPDSSAALKILATDNELGKFADADEGALADLLRDVAAQDIDGLLGTGFDQGALDALVAEVASATAPEGAPPAEGSGGAAGGDAPARGVTPPEDFPDVGAEGAIKTDHKCPRCSYEWSGAQK